MSELYRNDYLTVTRNADLVTFSWSKEEPGDEHAANTARAATAALEKHLAAEPGTRVRVLIDLMVVKSTFPRATAVYSAWLLSHRDVLSKGAFATGNFFLRTGIKAATLVPGLSLKGFSDLGEAKKFLGA